MLLFCIQGCDLSDLSSSGLKLLKAILQPLHLLDQLSAFLAQKVAIEFHKFKKAFRRGIVKVLLILLVFHTDLCVHSMKHSVKIKCRLGILSGAQTN